MQILWGVDPGSRHMGYGFVSWDGVKAQTLAYGVLEPPKKASFPEKLFFFHTEMKALVEQFQPTELCIERVFLGKNADSAFKLGHVRGVILSLGAEKSCQVSEYAPRHMKKVVTGQGGASKDQVSNVVRQYLGVTGPMAMDASDALALSLCRIHHSQVEAKLKRAVVS